VDDTEDPKSVPKERKKTNLNEEESICVDNETEDSNSVPKKRKKTKSYEEEDTSGDDTEGPKSLPKKRKKTKSVEEEDDLSSEEDPNSLPKKRKKIKSNEEEDTPGDSISVPKKRGKTTEVKGQRSKVRNHYKTVKFPMEGAEALTEKISAQKDFYESDDKLYKLHMKGKCLFVCLSVCLSLSLSVSFLLSLSFFIER
jgi:hypothetical protein